MTQNSPSVRLPRHIAVTVRSQRGQRYETRATLTLAQILGGRQVFSPKVIGLLRDGASAVEYNRNAPITLGFDPSQEQWARYYVMFAQDVAALIAHCEMHNALSGLFKTEVSAEDVTNAIRTGRLVLLPESEAPDPAEPAADDAGDPELAAAAVPPPVVAPANGDGPAAVTAFGKSTTKK